MEMRSVLYFDMIYYNKIKTNVDGETIKAPS